MNHSKFILPFLLLGALPVTAQEVHFSAGYNGSNVKKGGTDQWVGRPGYQFGADVLLGNRVFVKPGIHFLVRNLNYSFVSAAGAPATEYHYSSRSLSIPLMLGVNLLDPVDDPAFNLYVMGGPTVLANLNADLNNDQLDVKTSSTQWYLGFGAGVQFGFIFLEGGYDAALTKVFDRDDFDTNPRVNIIHLIAGVRLRLAK